MSMVYLPLYLLIGLFAIGVPVCFSLIISVIPYFSFIDQSIPGDLILQRMVSSLESPALLAIPFFITAGSILNYSGITRRLMDFADALVGHTAGGLAHVNVLLSTLMGGISGSAAADASMECKILVPEMEKRGYGRGFSAAVTAASANITAIIPPGNGLILYAFLTNASVGRMFAAGYLPGLLMCVLMMGLVGIISKRKGYLPQREERCSMREILTITRSAIWALILPLVIIMMIRVGVCTASECGALCCAYALIVGIFVYREIKWKHVWPILKDALLGTATVLMILCAANVLSWYLSYTRIPHVVTQALMSMNLSKYGFLLAISVLLLILGMFIEGNATLIILVPLLWPVAQSLGIDIIHFGLLMVFLTQIGAITPPFGVILFLVAPLLKIKVSELSVAILPFIFMFLVVLLLLIFIPALSTFLPTLIFG